MFNIGDVVWAAYFSMQPQQIECPVCFGKRQVVVILGNGDEVITPCSNCGLGYEGPRGFVEEYAQEAGAGCVIITGRTVQEGGGETRVIYKAGDYSYGADRLFSTCEEAMRSAEGMASEHKKEHETRAEYIKGNKIKSFSWNVGYHLREAKKLKEQIAYHERMAILCKAQAQAEEREDEEREKL